MKQLITKTISWTRAALTLLLVLLATAGAQAETVDESQVTFLWAIRSTGDQVFDTHYTHKANTRVEMDCEVTKNNQRDWEALFGARLHDFYSNAFCFFSRHHKNSAAVNGPCFNRSGVETVGSDFVYDERIKLICEGQTATWYKYSNQDTAAGSVTTTGTADDGKTPMFLFDLNTSSKENALAADGSRSVMTLYGCKIYEGSTLKCDFVPAKYNNTVGLYDRVNHTFSGSISPQPFEEVVLESDDVEILYAVYSTGREAFNTGYTHKANTRVELDCFVDENTQRRWESLFGARLGNSDHNAYMFFTRTASENVPCFCRSGNQMSGDDFAYGERIKLVCENQTATWYKYSDLSTAAGSITTTGTADDGKTPMFLFNMNNSSIEGGTEPDPSYSVMTLYGCKIYEGSTLKCDFVPARYKGVVGLYDRVNKTFSGSITGTDLGEVDAPSPEDDENYRRALDTIKDGSSYRVYVKAGGDQIFYLTADGFLSDNVADAAYFAFKKVTADEEEREYEYAFQLVNGNTYFTNPRKYYDEEALSEGKLNTTTKYSRETWEAQVFFLNAKGEYAIRSTNVKWGNADWLWAGRTFWNASYGDNGTVKPVYSFSPTYIWGIQEKPEPVSYHPTSGTAGTSATEDYDMLLDGDKSTKWCVSSFSSAFVEFHTPRAIIPTGYVLTTCDDNATWKGRNPKSWTIKAKANISDDWTTLATVTNDNTMQDVNTTDYEFSIDNDEAYQYFRFDVSAVQSGTILQLSEFAFLYNDEGVQIDGDLSLNYNRALEAIKNVGSYRIFTMVDGVKYYLTREGKLSTKEADAPLFKFNKVAPKANDGDGEYGYGFQIINGSRYFTNSSKEDGSALKEGHICTTTNNNRTTWETQVFFLNAKGKYAIRSTNAKSGDTGWAKVGTAFWTVDSSDNGPVAEYSYDIKYVWQIEEPSGPAENELLTNGQCDGSYKGWTKTDGGDGWIIGSYNGYYYWLSSYRVCKLTQTVTLSDFGISDEDIDNEKVICVASAEMLSATQDDEGNGARVNNIIVDMLDANDIQLATVTVLDDLNYYSDWTSFETKPFTLFPGTRKLRYTVRGQDAINYSGQHGPAYRNLSLQYKIGSQGGNNSGEPYSGKVLIGDLYYNLDGETKTAEVTYRDDDYNSYSGNVAIPDKVTFRGTDYTVTTVGYGAFYDCKDLTSVTIPSSVTTIDSWAFQSCPSLTSFTIPRNVTKMGLNPFAGCNGLTSLNVESGNTKYDSRGGCNAIIDSETNVLIAGCNTTVIPNTVKTLGQECFASLTKMTSIVIPDGVETIEYAAFFDCDGLTSVDIANSVTAIGEWAFEECDNLSEITLPSQLETIGDGAFYDCDNLVEINLPNSLKSIGNYAFYDSGIKKIFSEMTEPCQLGSYVFYNIYSTATLVVPEGTKSNYQNTGTEWDYFSYVVDGEFKEIANADGIPFYYILHPDSKTAEVTCKLRTDEQNEYSYSGDIVIPETVNSDGVEYTVTSIGDYAFRYCSGLTSLTIPNSVTSIGIRSIQYCPNLTTLTIPGSVTTIKDFAFNNCEGLTTVTLSEGIQSIGIAVFGGDIRLTSLTIPKSVTSIGDYPSWGCEALTSLEVESGNTKYDSRGGCNAIIETETNTLIQGCNVTVIPSDVKAIGIRAYYHFTGLTGITLPDGLETIGRYAFYECENLTSIVIPSSVTSIDYAAFWGCTALKEIHSLIETPFATGDYVFSDDTYTNATLYVPIGTKSAYEATELWSKFGNIVEEDYVVTYPVWVGDTQVTEVNKDDVLGDGTVTYEPGNGTGTLTFSSGTTTINGTYNAAKIYADGIDLVINAPKGLVVESNILGISMSGDNRKLTVNGDITFKTMSPAIDNCHDLIVNGNLSGTISSPISCSSITVNGNTTITSSGIGVSATTIVLNGTNHELNASSPCITSYGTLIVTGDLTATSKKTPAITSTGDVTLVSGTWTLDGGTIRAIELNGDAKLNIPSNYAIIEPENAQMKSSGSGYNAYTTIADAEGNEATHVVIGDNSALVTYTVNITGGKAFAQEPDPYVPMEAPVTEFKAGSTVYVLPNAVSGRYVTGWNTSPDIDITQKELVYYFKMPAENVTLTPVYSSQTPLTYDLSDGKQVRIGDNEDDLLALEGLLMIYWQQGQLLGTDEFDYYDLDGDGTNDITLYMDQDSEELVIQATDGTNLTGIYFTGNNISPFGPIKIKFSPEMLDEDSPEPTNFDKLAELGQEMSVILKRTLRAGGWNTFASPVTFSDFTNVFGEGVKVKQLKDATLTDGVLNLKFEDATTIEGYTPYLVKVAADVDLSQKTITGPVCDEPVIKETADLKFIPTMGTLHYQYTDDPKSVLFIGAGSKLYYADAIPLDIKGFRAFFVLNKPNAVRSVLLDFGDGETTGITSHEAHEPYEAHEWYTVDGRKLSKRPTAKGVYINHGKKTIVK